MMCKLFTAKTIFTFLFHFYDPLSIYFLLQQALLHDGAQAGEHPPPHGIAIGGGGGGGCGAWSIIDGNGTV